MHGQTGWLINLKTGETPRPIRVAHAAGECR